MAFKHVKKSNPLLMPALALIVIIALVAAYIAVQTPTAEQITSNKTITLSLNSSYNFMLPGNSTIASIFLASSSNAGAVLYLSKVPVLEKDIVIVPLSKGTPVNISVYGLQYADLQVYLVSSNSKNATISLAAIPKNLDINPETFQFLEATSFGSNQAKTSGITPNYTSITTTLQASTTSTTVTSVPSANAVQQAISYANSSVEGTLIVNYNHLYERAASQCVPPAYNNTYVPKHASVPKGQNTFYNVTPAIPTSIFVRATQISPTLYNMTYTAVISIGNLPALT